MLVICTFPSKSFINSLNSFFNVENILYSVTTCPSLPYMKITLTKLKYSSTFKCIHCTYYHAIHWVFLMSWKKCENTEIYPSPANALKWSQRVLAHMHLLFYSLCTQTLIYKAITIFSHVVILKIPQIPKSSLSVYAIVTSSWNVLKTSWLHCFRGFVNPWYTASQVMSVSLYVFTHFTLWRKYVTAKQLSI